MEKDLESRVTELEDEVKLLKRQLDDARAERDDALATIGEQNEWLEDQRSVLDQWIAAFDMVQNDKGEWSFGEWVRQRDELTDKYFAQIADWNKFVGQYNAVVAPKWRNIGRPLAASDAQKARVLGLRKEGESLQSIADETNLSLRTVRTIVDKADGVDRTTLARLEKIAPEKIKEKLERANRKSRKYLPARINALIAEADSLKKKARGQLAR